MANGNGMCTFVGVTNNRGAPNFSCLFSLHKQQQAGLVLQKERGREGEGGGETGTILFLFPLSLAVVNECGLEESFFVPRLYSVQGGPIFV